MNKADKLNCLLSERQWYVLAIYIASRCAQKVILYSGIYQFYKQHFFYLQTYGHDKVSILDGGLPMWITKGYPTVSGPQPAISAATYKANFQPERYRTMEQIKENLISKKEQVYMQSHHMHVHSICYFNLACIERERGREIY